MTAAARRRAFCIVVVPNGSARDIFVREVEPCEARYHLSLDEIESFLSGDSPYTTVEKARLSQQVQEIRSRM